VIDLHSHLLPGVDDGSRSVEQSVGVLTRMAAAGITDIVLTPHLDASRVLEGPPPEHDEAFAALSPLIPSGIRVHRGAEIMLDRALTPRVVATRRVTLGGSRYVLVEFTRLVASRAATTALHQVVKAGLVPLVAHPERYQVCSPAQVRQWRDLGALIQVDANTLFAASGRGDRARQLVGQGLADVLAADNHGDVRTLADPFRRLVEAGHEEVAQVLMVANPAAILADQPTEQVEACEITMPLFQRLKGWLGELKE